MADSLQRTFMCDGFLGRKYLLGLHLSNRRLWSRRNQLRIWHIRHILSSHRRILLTKKGQKGCTLSRDTGQQLHQFLWRSRTGVHSPRKRQTDFVSTSTQALSMLAFTCRFRGSATSCAAVKSGATQWQVMLKGGSRLPGEEQFAISLRLGHEVFWQGPLCVWELTAHL